MEPEKLKICILDYGSGNTRSVYNMLQSLEENTLISNSVDDIRTATHIILPGVGAFGASMQKIREKIPLVELHEEVFEKKKPFLGICVGMQVLANTGYEFGEEPGLGWIDGVVKKVEAEDLPLPHVGWNNVVAQKESPLLKDFGKEIDFYFVHSFCFHPAGDTTLAVTEYGQNFSSIIGRDNIYGVQFHPEKSQRAGILLMQNFLKLK